VTELKLRQQLRVRWLSGSFFTVGTCVQTRVVVLGVKLGALELAEEPSVIPGDSLGRLWMPTRVSTTCRGAEFSTDQTFNKYKLCLLALLANERTQIRSDPVPGLSVDTLGAFRV
jgi:hypothetical protein